MTRLTASLAAALLLAACGRRDELASIPTPVASPAPAAAPAQPARAQPSGTVAEQVAAAANLATLAAALTAAGLDKTLAGPGPYTVFAPTDAAFARLAPGVGDSLLKPENRVPLTRLLTYHVVPGAITAADLARRIAAGGGTASLTTVEGDPLTASMTGAVITLTDVNGNKSYVETADGRATNGIVHIVNGVLVPHLG